MVSKTIIGAACAYLMYIPFSAYAGIVTFTDNFDDPTFTNSHWLDGTPSVPQTWSFETLNGSDLGYHATVDSLITQDPASKVADNGKEYFNADLYIETLVRIDSHSAADSTTNKVFIGFGFSATEGYMAGIQMDFSGQPSIDLYLSAFIQGISEPILADTPVSIDFDTFYKLVVQGDSDQAMSVFLYDLNNTLLGSIASPKVLSHDKGAVAINGRYASTFNDFYLSGSTVPIPAAFWLFGSGLIGLIVVARRKHNYL